jgi:thioredoxin 1
MIELNEENWSEVMEGKLVVVDFWAPWCGPCNQMGPKFETAAINIDGAKFCKCNIDESDFNREAIAKAGVRSIPAFIMFKDAEVIDMVVGSEDDLETKLTEMVDRATGE